MTRNEWLLLYFGAYVLTTLMLFVGLGALTGSMPWDYWWVFLFITPPAVGAPLVYHAKAGRYNRWSVAAFIAGTVLLGWFYGWLAGQLAAVV